MAHLEVKRSPEGKILARRIDGQPLTAEDREAAKTIAEGAPIRARAAQTPDSPVPSDGDVPGVTVADVLRVFPGARVICRHCDKQKSVPEWRRGGKIIRRVWPDGRIDWGCHYCGREAKLKTQRRAVKNEYH